MSEATNSEQTSFECTGLTVYFIYSFALAKKEGYLDYKPVTPEYLFKEGEKTEGFGTPQNRRGIKQIIELRHEQMGWKKHDPIPAEVVHKDVTTPIQIEIQPLVRLFRAGATCCLRVRLKNSEGTRVEMSTIHAILQLVQQLEEKQTPSELQIQGETDLKNLHQVFHKCVNSYLTASGEDELGVALLDALVIPPRTDAKDEDQTPWVVTVAEVNGKTLDVFCGTFSGHGHPAHEKARLIKSYESKVASILYRSVKGEDLRLEPGYIDTRLARVQPGLHSINLDASLYVALSNRSVLCICREEGKKASSYFIPDLLDLCEVLRARWHMLIIMNTGLDLVLRQLSEPSVKAEDKMKIVIMCRLWIAQCLDDPELYRVAGDALANIALRLKEIFRESALRSLLLEKAQFIERIREGLTELSWLSTSERFREQLQR